MINRKKFIRSAGMLAAGSFLLQPKSFASVFTKGAYPPPGLQLFTLFNTIDADVEGTLKKVAAIGYKEIESAFSKKGGFYGLSAKAFSKMVADQGMAWKSHHALGAPFKLPAGAKMPTDANGNAIKIPPMKNLRENMQEIVNDIVDAGIPFLVCASTPIDTADEIQKSIETLNKTGEACKKAGITLCYHNHDREFKAVDGKMPYDLFLSQLSPDIKMELDLCWVTKAGVDPVALFKKHPGRFPLWHVKDLDKSRQGPAPAGEGVVDFKRIFENATTAGLKHYFVEHDMPKDPFASITTSIHYLKDTLHV
ncbi:sugar phosphate isomerase/epimerase family protein [Niabella soli]|uniref:Xylose isomerase n=1 Tax=Niabella soli DSM 19437 TaxID=929713 RepID=W0F3U0_9BACT|nr:sugar phosphate isomerase/epimerase [Niabella soli]AHF16483.1 xylose isomerase [Niabella soli DSM 19437]